MNRGRQGSFSIGGYTVVETLIFLAVTSVIFISAALLISGRQARAQFESGVRGFETRLADIANNVATGYYESPGKTKACSVTPTGPRFDGADTDLGMNKNCVFVGTVIKLGDGTNKENLIQYDMAGLRKNGDLDVTSLAEAKPQILDTGTPTSFPIGGGIEVACVAVDSDTCVTGAPANAAIGFFSSFEGASMDGSGGGSVQADVINYGPNVLLTDDAASAATKINNFTGYSSAALNHRITICLVGGLNQHALVKLGGNASSALTVTSEIKDGETCN